MVLGGFLTKTITHRKIHKDHSKLDITYIVSLTVIFRSCPICRPSKGLAQQFLTVTQDPKTDSKSARNVFEVKWITSEYYYVKFPKKKFLNKGIESFRGIVIQEFPPCATTVNSLSTHIATLSGQISIKYAREISAIFSSSLRYLAKFLITCVNSCRHSYKKWQLVLRLWGTVNSYIRVFLKEISFATTSNLILLHWCTFIWSYLNMRYFQQRNKLLLRERK